MAHGPLMPYNLPLAPRPRGSTIPLTAVQKRYWHYILARPDRLSPFRNPAAALRLSGHVDRLRLEQSIQTALDRHESLRTRIAHFDQSAPPSQIVDPPQPFRLDIADLSESPENAREIDARALARRFFSQEVDLTESLPFSAKLIRLSSHDHILLLALDHIASDATSYPILTQQVLSPLSASADPPQSAAPPPIQFADFAVWQHNTMLSWHQKHESYWRAKLSELPATVIPTDTPASNQPPTPAVSAPLRFGPTLSTALREAARREHFLAPLVVLSLYAVVMSRWCRRNPLLISFLSHGRYLHASLRDMIGCIAHPVILRVEMSPKEPLRDLVRRVTAELHSSLAHDASRLPIQETEPTELYFNWLPSEWNLSGTAASAIRMTDDAKREIRFHCFQIEKPVIAKFSPVFTDTPSGITAEIWYDSDLFLPSTVETFATHLRLLVENFSEDPNLPLDCVDLRI